MRETQRAVGRIAVIEDDATLQGFMNTLLTDEGYEVIGWPSAAGAHAFNRREHPDAVLLDLWLEDRWSGIRLAEELHYDPATVGTPVVVVTGDIVTLRAHRDDLVQLGCDIEIMPFDIADLLGKVGRLLVPH